MDIEQIKYFLGITTWGSFTTASEELCISQSSLSKRIKALEEELNVKLFERTTRSVKLTPAGEDFEKYAKHILSGYYDLVNAMNQHAAAAQNELSIATIPVISQYGIAAAIASYRRISPHTNIKISENENDYIIQLLKNAEIDIAFIRSEYLPNDSFDVYPLLEDELVLVTSTQHKLAMEEKIDFRMLENENLILLNSSSGIFETCMNEFNQLHITPNILYKNNRLETILGLVAEGLGVSLLMKRVVTYFNNPNLVVIPLQKPIKSTLSLVTSPRKKQSLQAKEFKKFMIEHFENTVK